MKAFLKISWHFFFNFCKVSSVKFMSLYDIYFIVPWHINMYTWSASVCFVVLEFIFLFLTFFFENLSYVKCNTNLNCIILWVLTYWNLCTPNHFHNIEHYNQSRTLHIGITRGTSARCQLGLYYGMFQGSPGDSNGLASLGITSL